MRGRHTADDIKMYAGEKRQDGGSLDCGGLSKPKSDGCNKCYIENVAI